MTRRLHVFAYDISDDRRRARVASLLQAAGTRVQESVFEIRSDAGGARRLYDEARRRMMPPDTLRVYAIPDRMIAHCFAFGGAPISEAGDYLMF